MVRRQGRGWLGADSGWASVPAVSNAWTPKVMGFKFSF
jgi:hypothetical protein